jgi:hypothetical protein
MRIWISATCRSKSRAINDWPSSLIQCILVSTRLRRWYPLQRRHRVRPRYRCALTASLREIAPVLVGFQGFAFLRGGTTAWASLAAVRRQSFWYQSWFKLSESLAHLVNYTMLRACCDASVALRMSFV